MADRGHRPVVGAPRPSARRWPGMPRRARSTRSMSFCAGERRPGRRPTGDRRTGRRRMPRSPALSRPAIGWPPTNHRPAASARSTIAGLGAGDVGHDRVGPDHLAPLPGETVDQRQARGRRAGQDDQVRITQDGLGLRLGGIDDEIGRRLARSLARTATRRPSSSPSSRGWHGRRARSSRRSDRSRGTRSACPRVSQPPRPECAERRSVLPAAGIRRPRRAAAPCGRRDAGPSGGRWRGARFRRRRSSFFAFLRVALGPRRRMAAPGRWTGSRAGSPSGARRRDDPPGNTLRSAGSGAPRRSSTTAARPNRSGARRSGRLDGAWVPRVRPWAGRRVRPRPSRAGIRSPRGCRRGSARRPTGRSDRGRTG